jgi:hypothetical protein
MAAVAHGVGLCGICYARYLRIKNTTPVPEELEATFPELEDVVTLFYGAWG